MEAAYFDNWIAGAVVDHPVEDATREWRTFTGKDAAKIHEAEKKSSFRKKHRPLLPGLVFTVVLAFC
jgi:hypothetical protein